MNSDELELKKCLKKSYDAIKIDNKNYTAYLQAGEYHAMLGEMSNAFSCFNYVAIGANGMIRWAGLIKKATVMMHLNCFSLSNIIEPLMEAYNLVPNHIDPLIVAAQACRQNQQYHQALLYATMAIGVKMPEKTKNQDLYIWKGVYEYALCADLAGYKDNAIAAFKEINDLDQEIKIPIGIKQYIKQRLNY